MISQKLLCLLLAGLCQCAVGADDIASRLEKFVQLERSQNLSGGSSVYVAERSKTAYAEAFNGIDPTAESELAAVLRALRAVTLYSGDKGHGRLALKYFERYQVKYPVSPSLAEMVFDSLSSARLFTEANAVADRYPRAELQRIKVTGPISSDGLGKFGVLEYSDSTNSFVQDRVELPEETFMVVVANPLCGFSRRAIAGFEGDAALSRLLSRTKWLIPPASRLSPSKLRDWNVSHPAARMGVVFDALDWPSLSIWETPTFYVYKGRELISIHIGWRGDADAEKLKRAME